ncbi:hypothetical protein RvY_03465 [Ramazzottius varieornatus]|uniref:Uncharacterized protein n=1 Tax=Ramazzottius varieornatus TaxID=947166 RepID=A0A1D1UTW4_RAMVA|nr:hypothetical protein RvY_03465 [Ramazzottius varieornatus]
MAEALEVPRAAAGHKASKPSCKAPEDESCTSGYTINYMNKQSRVPVNLVSGLVDGRYLKLEHGIWPYALLCTAAVLQHSCSTEIDEICAAQHSMQPEAEDCRADSRTNT